MANKRVTLTIEIEIPEEGSDELLRKVANTLLETGHYIQRNPDLDAKVAGTAMVKMGMAASSTYKSLSDAFVAFQPNLMLANTVDNMAKRVRTVRNTYKGKSVSNHDAWWALEKALTEHAETMRKAGKLCLVASGLRQSLAHE